MNRIVHSENLVVLERLPSASVDLIVVDPPFNTGRRQTRPRLRTTRDPAGDRIGFGGHRYRTEILPHPIEATPGPASTLPQPVLSTPPSPAPGYADTFDDLAAYLRPRMVEAHRILTPEGSLFVHLDYREVHYCKVMLDQVFTRPCFQNEIIWAYDYGARPTRRWPAKHDTLLWYTRDPDRYTFNSDEIDRIPYLAPTLVGAEKAARGKTPTDVWWHTIVSPTGREKTGYPTQKPLGVLDRIVRVHSRPGDTVLDFFAGSGTTGVAAARHGRHFLLIDQNPEAIRIMERRLAPWLTPPQPTTRTVPTTEGS